MRAWKVGDRVRTLTHDNASSRCDVNDVGTITHIDTCDAGFVEVLVDVKRLDQVDTWGWRITEIELIPKVKKVKKVTKRELWGETYTGIYFVAASCDEEYANLLAAAAKHMRENTTSFVSALNFQRDDQDNLTLELVVSS